MLHHFGEMPMVSANIPHDQPDALEHLPLQYGLTGKVRTALVLVFPVKQTVERGTLMFTVVDGFLLRNQRYVLLVT